MTDQRTTFGGDKVAAVLYRDGVPDPAQFCRFVGDTRPWCVIHNDWWASDGRCGTRAALESEADPS